MVPEDTFIMAPTANWKSNEADMTRMDLRESVNSKLSVSSNKRLIILSSTLKLILVSKVYSISMLYLSFKLKTSAKSFTHWDYNCFLLLSWSSLLTYLSTITSTASTFLRLPSIDLMPLSCFTNLSVTNNKLYNGPLRQYMLKPATNYECFKASAKNL